MTDDERRMLDFAGQRWQYAGNHETAIRAEFGVALTRSIEYSTTRTPSRTHRNS